MVKKVLIFEHFVAKTIEKTTVFHTIMISSDNTISCCHVHRVVLSSKLKFFIHQKIHHLVLSMSSSSSSSSHIGIPLSFQNTIHYEPKYRALICLLCHHAIGLKAIEKHLMKNHRINFDQRTEFRNALKNIDATEKINTIPIPVDDQPPIKGLTVYDGYKCNDCEKMKTISLPVIR